MSNESAEVAVSDLPASVVVAEGAAVVASPSFGDIPLDCIRVSKTNPRKIFDENHLQDLAASIKKQGVAQPILVRPIETAGDVTYFELVAGERRFRASRLAGKTTVPAIVRVLDDREAFELQVLENLQRIDLHPLEEAEGFEALMKQFNVSADELAEKVGKSKAYIYASLKLCALEPKPRESFYAGALSKSTALLVARIPVKKLQEQAVQEITSGWQGPMSVRKAFEHIERTYMLNLSKAAFKPSDQALLPAAGSCTACPKRTGNQPEIFDDVKNAHVCTDPVCYKAKGEAHVIRIKQLAKESGQPVLSGAEAKKIMPNNWGAIAGGYVKVDQPVHSDDKQRSYRKILGKDLPQTTLLESPHDGEIIHVIKLDQIKPLLEKKGHKVPTPTVDNSAREREKAQEAKAKLEREYRKRLFKAVHHASHMMNLVDMDLRLVALQLLRGWAGSSNTSATVMMELYGWTNETFAWPDRGPKLKAAIDALTPAQLNQFIRDCVLARDLDVNAYALRPQDKPDQLLAFAARAKVDPKPIRAEVDAEAKAKATKKTKGAAKKSDKKAPTEPKKSGATEGSKPTPKKSVADPRAQKPDSGRTAWPFPTSSRPAAPAAQPVAVEDQPAPEVAAAPAAQANEELFPSPIDVTGLQASGLVEYLKPRLGQINEIKDKIGADRPDLITALEQAANSLGYVFASGGFQLQESKPADAAPADDHAEQASSAEAAQPQPAADLAADPGLDEMASGAAGIAPKTAAPKQRKTTKAKKAAAAEATS